MNLSGIPRRRFAPVLGAILFASGWAMAQPWTREGTWTAVASPPPFNIGASRAMLMTDGSVMIQDFCSSDWWSLTPDLHGSYVHGTWARKASMPSNYGPLFYASAVLPDGKLIANGGEYNLGGTNCQGALTSLGAIYDPVTDEWTPVDPPPAWGRIADSPSVVLSDGTYMVGNLDNEQQALLDEATMTWTITGEGKQDVNREEGWTLLPSGKVLTVDVAAEPNSELYDPVTGTWSSAGKTPEDLTRGAEIGPQVLRPDGTVFVIGFRKYTSIYDSRNGAWTEGPREPYAGGHQLVEADGPATLLGNGDILLPLSRGVITPTYFFLTDGKSFRRIAAPENAVNDEAEQFSLLMLPTGQVLATDWSNDVEIYTPSTGAVSGIEPVVTSVPTNLARGRTYTVTGRRFNGFSQTNFYGDDAQNATNYPLVRIVNDATGHVFYARTHHHSFMGVASQELVSTLFDVPAGMELGLSSLYVVANGISSEPVVVEIR